MSRLATVTNDLSTVSAMWGKVVYVLMFVSSISFSGDIHSPKPDFKCCHELKNISYLVEQGGIIFLDKGGDLALVEYVSGALFRDNIGRITHVHTHITSSDNTLNMARETSVRSKLEQDARRKKQLAAEEKEALELIARYQRKEVNKAAKGTKSSSSSAAKPTAAATKARATKAVSTKAKLRASGKKAPPSPLALPPSMRGSTGKAPVSKRTGKPKVLKYVSDSESDDGTDDEEPVKLQKSKKPVTPVKKVTKPVTAANKFKAAKVAKKTKKAVDTPYLVGTTTVYPDQEWKCEKCTLVNAGKLLKCSACKKKPSQKCRLAGV